ncbi:MAG: hypothetical protein BM557_03720 [Flavobacterium sp. MedPE-SWcel]|nr:MAG: hypothetical protein BM557_03720 [Flavobacterium sp. MedPE-SWcel]
MFSQSIGDYKYLVVPERFEFQSESGEFDLNELTKKMFEREGFVVFYSKDQMPPELALDKCKAAYVDLHRESNFTRTRMTITITDCWGRVLFTSDEGVSKAKEHKRAAHESLREASHSLYKMEEATDVILSDKEMDHDPTYDSDPKDKSILYAYKVKNGYQLSSIDREVSLRIYKTSQLDLYIAVGEDKRGVLLKDDDNWFLEYYKDKELIIEKLNIKF